MLNLFLTKGTDLPVFGYSIGITVEGVVVAAKMAIQSPLLETSIAGARGIIINITGSSDIGFEEVEIASSMIREQGHPDANIIWGAAFDTNLVEEL